MKRALRPVLGLLVIGACSKGQPTNAPEGATPTGPPGPATGAGVLTRNYDLQRTGANLAEKVLTPALVASGGFGKLYCNPVDDEIYAQILYLPGLDLGPTAGKRDVLFVLTVNNGVYAFDALATAASAPLWEKHFSDPAQGIVAVPTADLARTTCGNYKDMSHGVGIVSTPALDPATRTMYLVARTKENGAYFQRLHAIDLVDGSERPGSPVDIAATSPGTGAGNVNGVIAFDPMRNNQRGALLLHQGTVYITWSSHCDEGPYHGWVMGYDAGTLAQQVVWNATPGGGGAGIWMSGAGPSVDPEGNLILVTGNGTADLEGGPNRGESFVKLRRQGGTLEILDWFTPFNYLLLERGDRDLGASGALLVPGKDLVVGGSKEGKLYVLDRKALGGYQAGNGDKQVIQMISVTGIGRSHIHGTPVYWKTAAGEYLYVMAEEDYLKQMVFVDGKLQLHRMSALRSPVDPGPKPGGYTMPGGVLALSADGARPGSAVLWASTTLNKDSNQAVVPGILRAFDADDVSAEELWNSERDPRDSLGAFSKFNPPTVYNGRVYLPTFSKQYCVYGRLPEGERR